MGHLGSDGLEQRRRRVPRLRTRPHQLRQLARSKGVQPRRRCVRERVEPRRAAGDGVGAREPAEVRRAHVVREPRAARGQPLPQRLRPLARRAPARRMQARKAVRGRGERSLVEAGQRARRGRCERLEQPRLRPQRAPLGRLARQLAQRAPRRAQKRRRREPLALLRVRVDHLPHGSHLADLRHGRRASVSSHARARQAGSPQQHRTLATRREPSGAELAARGAK